MNGNMKEIILPDIMISEEENTEEYEQYSCRPCSCDSSVLLFTAGRRGRGHIAKNQPYQDYAMNAEMKYGVILCAADGLGSCAHSDEGSLFACESAVRIISQIAEKTKSETMFIKKLNRLFTRKRIVMEWMERIRKAYADHNGREPEDLYEASREYNSTLMTAVITDHFIYVMNIGDGQVLLFNSDYAYRLRPYMKKNSSVTDSLHDSRSWMEGFQATLFPRRYFSGVLLSSDGIYDFLSEGQSFHCFACQIAERFVSAAKPSFPFDYVTEDGKIHHIYDGGSFDDCTVNLAVMMKPVSRDPVHEYVRNTFEMNAVERMSRNVRRYHVRKDEREAVLITSPEIHDFSVSCVQMLHPHSETDSGAHHYALYENIPFTSLEEMHAKGMFRLSRTTDTKHLLYAGGCYAKLKQLADELASQNMKLNESCGFLCGFDQAGNLILCKEAVTSMKQEKPGERYAWINVYFRSIFGFLVFENRKLPVFRKGMNEIFHKIERFDGLDHQPLGIIASEGNTYRLINTGKTDWVSEHGEIIREGESLPLESHVSFSFSARNDIRLTYHFVKKEDL